MKQLNFMPQIGKITLKSNAYFAIYNLMALKLSLIHICVLQRVTLWIRRTMSRNDKDNTDLLETIFEANGGDKQFDK